MPQAPRAKPPRPPQFEPIPPGPGDPTSVFLTVLIVSCSLFGLVVLGASIFEDYGYSLFLLLPCAAGFASAWLSNRSRSWSWKRTATAVSLTLGLCGLLILGVEGFLCVIMAATLAVAFAAIGAVIACIIARLNGDRRFLFFMAALCPLTMGFEHRFPPSPPLLEQTTVIEIDAPPDMVWRFVPAFPKIQSDPQGLLALGMAFPIESTMSGEGAGAQRRCVLSTGDMPEVITRWEPGRALEFDVLHTPPAMVETNPLFDVHPAHVEGYFTVKRGRFILIPLPDGRTRVEGTSWFQHDLWPQFYWAPITRATVRQVHERVLTHIKALSEQAAAQ